jgi:hypothetical protein
LGAAALLDRFFLLRGVALFVALQFNPLSINLPVPTYRIPLSTRRRRTRHIAFLGQHILKRSRR